MNTVIGFPLSKGKPVGKVDAYGLNLGACLHQFFVVKRDINIAVPVGVALPSEILAVSDPVVASWLGDKDGLGTHIADFFSKNFDPLRIGLKPVPYPVVSDLDVRLWTNLDPLVAE